MSSHCRGKFVDLLTIFSDPFDDFRLIELATVEDGGNHESHLQGGHQHKTLTDRHGNGLSPLPGYSPSLQLPLLRRNEPSLIPAQIKFRVPAEPTHSGIFRDLVDSKSHAQLVKIDIAGLDQGPVKGCVTMPPPPPATIGPPQLVTSVTKKFLVGIDQSFLQSGKSYHDLKNGTRRIQARNRSVLQRGVLAGNDFLPFTPVNAANKEAWVKGRTAGHRKNLPTFWIQGHNGSVSALQPLFCNELQFPVYGKTDICSRDRRLSGNDPELSPSRIHLDLLSSPGSVEVVLPPHLDTVFTYKISRFIFDEFSARQLSLIDFPHVTDDMGCEIPENIIALGFHLDHDPGEVVETGLYQGQFLPGQAFLDQNRVEGVPSGGFLQSVLHKVGRQGNQFVQTL